MFKENVVIALGVFDGVHRGHQKIVKELKELGMRTKCKPLVAAFRPNPLEILTPDKAPKQLGSYDSRAQMLSAMDVCVEELMFDEKVAHLTGEDFWAFLKDTYNVKGVVVGFNFHFGDGAKWDGNDLLDMVNNDRRICRIVDAYIMDGEAVSSTRIRSLLDEGKVLDAGRLLGRPYSITGTVVMGRQFGRTIGFPTANLEIDPGIQVPMKGTYITKAKVEGEWHIAMTNIGENPTVNGKGQKVETFILDFDKEIYDYTIEVQFFKRMRDENAFETIEALKAQLKKDKETVVSYFV